MLTKDDLVWLLNNLPSDITHSIIAVYYPLCFFIMDNLGDYNWAKQGKIIFGTSDIYDLYSYYCTCKRLQQYKPIMISGGCFHTNIHTNNKLLSCGYNFYGQLGHGDTSDRSKFDIIKSSNIIQIACGAHHTVILTANGTLMASGCNENGQLGLNYIGPITIFEKVNAPKVDTSSYDRRWSQDVIKIACGSHHTVILRADGSIYATGHNIYGQLGLGDRSDRTQFTHVPGIQDAIDIACGNNHTIVMLADGSLMSCGSNLQGQLGLGDLKNRSKFTAISNIKNIVQISCGSHHSIILERDGTVMGCGSNEFCQLGLVKSTKEVQHFQQIYKNIIQITCSSHNTIMRSKNNIFGCGLNWDGELGFVGRSNQITPIFESSEISEVIGFGHTTWIIKNDDTILTCGDNAYGQLGLGDTSNRNSFVELNKI